MKFPLFSETIQYLKKDQHMNNTYYLTNPHLLYMSGEQAKSYIQLTKNEKYCRTFHNDTLEIIHSNLDKMFEQMEYLSLIDLGPGYPDKSLPIAQFMKMKKKPVYYYPVDVSMEFLRIAEQAIKPFVSSVTPLCARFEECQNHLSLNDIKQPRYVMIGITFMNFLPEIILPLLKTIAGINGKILLVTELISDKSSKEQILSCYQSKENEEFSFGPLKNLGFEKDAVKYIVTFNNSRVENQFTLRSDFQCRGIYLRKGDKIITGISHRYTLSELNSWLDKYFQDIIIYLSRNQTTALAICSPSK